MATTSRQPRRPPRACANKASSKSFAVAPSIVTKGRSVRSCRCEKLARFTDLGRRAVAFMVASLHSVGMSRLASVDSMACCTTEVPGRVQVGRPTNTVITNICAHGVRVGRGSPPVKCIRPLVAPNGSTTAERPSVQYTNDRQFVMNDAGYVCLFAATVLTSPQRQDPLLRLYDG